MRIAKQNIRSYLQFGVYGLFIFGSLSCAGLKDLATPKRPHVAFQGVHLDKLSFGGVDLLFDLKIDNPNAFGVSLAGFDYELFINKNSFLNGVQDEKQSIEANGSSTIQFPLGVQFASLLEMVSSLKQADSTQYKIDLGFSFDVPILGVIKVPVSKKGTLPVLKLPKISLGDIKLKKLNFTGADLELNLALDNPNAFSATFERLDYALSIGGQPIAKGLSNTPVRVNKKARNMLSIPISLNFLQSGRTIYNILTGKEKMNYNLSGNFDVSTSLKDLSKITLPFDRSGSIDLSR